MATRPTYLNQYVVDIHRARGFRRTNIHHYPLETSIKVQATIGGDRKDTDGSMWGAGVAADEDLWRNDSASSGRLMWQWESKELRKIKSSSPCVKLFVYSLNESQEATSLGWFVVDLR